MAETDDNVDLWFRYIAKLNDRALNRQMASGITTWVLVAVIAALLFQVIMRVPTLTTQTGAAHAHLLALVCTLNTTSFAFFLLLALLLKGIPTEEVRVATRLDRAQSPGVYVPVFGIMCLMTILNLVEVMFADSHGLSRWPFMIIGVFVTLQLVVPVLSKFRSIIRAKGHSDLPDLSTPFFFASEKLRKMAGMALGVTATVGLFVSLVPVVQALPRITQTSQIETVKWSMQVTALLFLSALLCFRLAGMLHELHLLCLERRLVVEGLSAHEVRDLYIREFLGQTVQAWVSEVEQELSQRRYRFDEAATKAESLFSELRAIDPTMTYEIAGRKEEICKGVKEEWHCRPQSLGWHGLTFFVVRRVAGHGGVA